VPTDGSAGASPTNAGQGDAGQGGGFKGRLKRLTEAAKERASSLQGGGKEKKKRRKHIVQRRSSSDGSADFQSVAPAEDGGAEEGKGSDRSSRNNYRGHTL
jgi:hypothetical protein